MIIAQVCIRLATIKGTLKCAVLSQAMLQMSQVLRERAISMLTAGMSTRAVTRQMSAYTKCILSRNIILNVEVHFKSFF